VLAAHLVPGYFAVVTSQPQWRREWKKWQQVVLWTAALASTFAPDLDVIYNALFHGFVNHNILWTHSVFVHLSIGLCWWLLRGIRRWPYLQTLVGLVVVGGLSHLVLDVVSHGTPLLYPVSLYMFGAPSTRVLEGGVLAYVTDPIFLAEPFLLALAVAHWIISGKPAPRVMRLALFGLVSGLAVFVSVFLLLLPMLQSIIMTLGTG
jgi:hypothetical protein